MGSNICLVKQYDGAKYLIADKIPRLTLPCPRCQLIKPRGRCSKCYGSGVINDNDFTQCTVLARQLKQAESDGIKITKYPLSEGMVNCHSCRTPHGVEQIERKERVHGEKLMAAAINEANPALDSDIAKIIASFLPVKLERSQLVILFEVKWKKREKKHDH